MLAINDKTAVVRNVLLICAITKSLYTSLNSIELIGGQKFPDIVSVVDEFVIEVGWVNLFHIPPV